MRRTALIRSDLRSDELPGRVTLPFHGCIDHAAELRHDEKNAFMNGLPRGQAEMAAARRDRGTGKHIHDAMPLIGRLKTSHFQSRGNQPGTVQPCRLLGLATGCGPGSSFGALRSRRTPPRKDDGQRRGNRPGPQVPTRPENKPSPGRFCMSRRAEDFE